MQFDLKSTLQELKLPVTLIALFAAILGMVGLDLQQVLDVVGSLVGFAALIALLINVLKWAGALPNGSAGVLSAILNLVVFAGVAVTLKLFPTFDFASLDAQVAEFARVAGILFGYIVMLVGSKQTHKIMVNGIGIQAFQHPV